MGVITKSDKTINIKTSVSEETLYIPSSDDDQSEVSVAVRHAQSRILRNHRIPVVESSSPGVRPNCGRRKHRRHLNANNLMTLMEEDEPKEVTIEDFVNSSRTRFSQLLEDGSSLQKWEEFISSTEEHQEQMLSACEKKQPSNTGPQNCSSMRLTRTLRSLLKKRNLPLGMVQYLEKEVVDFFSTMPKNTYISPELTSFERLLLHCVSDYHCLQSQSVMTAPKKMKIVHVDNPREEFPTPPLLLAEYLLTTYAS